MKICCKIFVPLHFFVDLSVHNSRFAIKWKTYNIPTLGRNLFIHSTHFIIATDFNFTLRFVFVICSIFSERSETNSFRFAHTNIATSVCWLIFGNAFLIVVSIFKSFFIVCNAKKCVYARILTHVRECKCTLSANMRFVFVGYSGWYVLF